MLFLGALFCGFSQGMFIPQLFVEVSNAVKPVSTAMAMACLTCFMSFGQFISPIVMNTLSRIIFGEVTTIQVFLIASGGMAVSMCVVIASKARQKSTTPP
jgi:hypothetical protein